MVILIMGIINYTKKSLRLHGLGDFSLGEFFTAPNGINQFDIYADWFLFCKKARMSPLKGAFLLIVLDSTVAKPPIMGDNNTVQAIQMEKLSQCCSAVPSVMFQVRERRYPL